MIYVKTSVFRRGVYEFVEGAPVNFYQSHKLQDLWLEVRGNGVNHIVKLAALERAGFTVAQSEVGNDRAVVVMYQGRTALIGEGLRTESGGMFK